MTRNDETLDSELRLLVRQACAESTRGIETASFQTLWSRARVEFARRDEKVWRMPRLGWVLAPAVALIALVLVIQYRQVTTPEILVQDFFASAAQPRLPSDGLLADAKRTYKVAQVQIWSPPKMGLIQPEFPTDSLKWSTQ